MRSGRPSAVRSTGHMHWCVGVVGSELVQLGCCGWWDVVMGWCRGGVGICRLPK
jgi:hypothetical protein